MTRKQFDAQYVNGKIAVFCETKEQAKKFLELANSMGYYWLISQKGHTHWLPQGIYYNIGNGTIKYTNSEKFYVDNGYKIVKFGYTPKELLTHLDTVTTRRGNVYIFIKGADPLFTNVNFLGGFYLSTCDDDLKEKGIGSNYDIMRIAAPDGTIKWEREERRERTAKEIELESIRLEMEKLSARMKELEK